MTLRTVRAPHALRSVVACMQVYSDDEVISFLCYCNSRTLCESAEARRRAHTRAQARTAEFPPQNKQRAFCSGHCTKAGALAPPTLHPRALSLRALVRPLHGTASGEKKASVPPTRRERPKRNRKRPPSRPPRCACVTLRVWLRCPRRTWWRRGLTHPLQRRVPTAPRHPPRRMSLSVQ